MDTSSRNIMTDLIHGPGAGRTHERRAGGVVTPRCGGTIVCRLCAVEDERGEVRTPGRGRRRRGESTLVDGAARRGRRAVVGRLCKSCRRKRAPFRRNGSGERMRGARTGLAQCNRAERSGIQYESGMRARTGPNGPDRKQTSKGFGGVRFKAQN